MTADFVCGLSENKCSSEKNKVFQTKIVPYNYQKSKFLTLLWKKSEELYYG